MNLINELRVVQLASPRGSTIVGREHVVGIDARWSGRGVAFERHIPTEVVVSDGANENVVPIENGGLPLRLLPYLAAPVLAIMVTRIFRAKG